MHTSAFIMLPKLAHSRHGAPTPSPIQPQMPQSVCSNNAKMASKDHICDYLQHRPVITGQVNLVPPSRLSPGTF